MVATPSATYWYRVEGRPRSELINEGLMVRVADPLWILTRQWQFGEFQGEDSGSPAFVESSFRLGTMVQWRPEGKPTTPLTGAPLEALAESEPFTPDLSVKVEVGQVFETLLAQNGVAQLIADFRAAYPFPSPQDDAQLGSIDAESTRFVLLCRGRVVDGLALYEAARGSLPSLPPRPPLPASQQAAALTALTAFIHWVDETFGNLGAEDPPAWRPDRLEYTIQTIATLPDGTAAVMSAVPDSDGFFEWHAFDLQADQSGDIVGPPTPPTQLRRSVIPTHVRFRGMPNARWWDFESNTTDFGAMAPDLRDVARLVDKDFLLIHATTGSSFPSTSP